MTQVTIPATAIPANTLTQLGGSVTCPSGLSSAQAQITDPNNQWSTVVGNLIAYGCQTSTDNGATWTDVIFEGSSSGSTPVQAFGTFGKNGGLPIVREVNPNQLISAAGSLARLVIKVDTDITLGSIVTTTP